MASEKMEFKRVGAPIAISVENEYVYIKIELDGKPPDLWKELFRNPKERVFDSVHPTNAVFKGDQIFFRSERSTIEDSIEWMDKYIEQANTAYKTKTQAQQTDSDRREKRRKEQSETKETELKRITESMKHL